jgi:hypothetical protein
MCRAKNFEIKKRIEKAPLLACLTLPFFTVLCFAALVMLVFCASLFPHGNNAARAEDSKSEGVTITLKSMTPIINSKQDLHIVMTVSNNTNEDKTDLDLEYCISTQNPFVTRYQLITWSSKSNTFMYPDFMKRESVGKISAGKSVDIEYSIKAADILNTSSRSSAQAEYSNAFPIQINLSSNNTGEVLSSIQSFVLLQDNPSTETGNKAKQSNPKFSINFVASLTGDFSQTSENSIKNAEELLKQTIPFKQVSWAIDTALANEKKGVLDSASLSEKKKALMSDFLTESSNRNIFALPPNDTDFYSLAHNDINPDSLGIEANLSSANIYNSATGKSLILSMLPILRSGADTQTLKYLQTHGANKLLVQNVRKLQDTLNYTPGAKINFELEGAPEDTPEGAKPIEGIEDDSVLTNIINRNSNIDNNNENLSKDSDSLTTQSFLAQSLIASKEQPEMNRKIVVLVDKSSDAVGNILKALSSASWLTLADTNSVFASEEDTLAASTVGLDPQIQTDGELTAEELGELSASYTKLKDFASITQDPSAFLSENSESITVPLSQNLKKHQDKQRLALDDAENITDNIISLVSIAPISSMNMISESAQIPITVKNELPVTVKLFVDVKPGFSGIITSSGKEEVKIGANSEVLSKVTIKAEGGGVSKASAILLSQKGVEIGHPSEFSILTIAQIGRAGFILFAVMIAVFLVAGIVRTLKRGRSDARQKREELNG